MGALNGARVLVTGATGFIGRQLVGRLRGEGLSRLVLLARRPIEGSHGAEVSIACDLADVRSTTWRDASVEAFDIVFHLAASIVKTRTQDPSRADIVRSNVVGTNALLESLQASRCRFVFASAVDVFAPSEDVIDESSPLRTAELYPASKLMGEALVSDWAHRAGSSALIARVGHVYGPGEAAFGKAIPTFIRAALDGRPLIVYGDGSTARDLLYVTDAAEALVRAASASLDEESTVMIVAGSSSTTIAELAHHVAGLAGRPGSVTFERDRDAGCSTRFNTEKMKRLIGEWRQVPLSVGLREEIDYFRRGPTET